MATLTEVPVAARASATPRPQAVPQSMAERHRAILALVREGVCTMNDLRARMGISRARLTQLLQTCPGIVRHRTMPAKGGAWHFEIALDDATREPDPDDEPWSPQPWIHPYRAPAPRTGHVR